MKNQASALNFILRFSDNLRGVDTFAEHKKIETAHKAVWWGKFGVGAGKSIIDRAKEQLKAGIPTYVFLATNGSIRYRGELVDILGGGGSSHYQPKDLSLVPSYYRGEKLSVWFKLKNLREVAPREKECLVLFNDKASRPALQGMKALIYVCQGERQGKKPRPVESKEPDWPEANWDDELESLTNLFDGK